MIWIKSACIHGFVKSQIRHQAVHDLYKYINFSGKLSTVVFASKIGPAMTIKPLNTNRNFEIVVHAGVVCRRKNKLVAYPKLTGFDVITHFGIPRDLRKPQVFFVVSTDELLDAESIGKDELCCLALPGEQIQTVISDMFATETL